MFNDFMLEINSEAVQAIHWNPDTLVLTVRFQNGGLYEYYKVTPLDFAALFFNGSVGSAFAEHKNRFEFKKIN